MAARFWVGGTGTWDASDTTHWAASTGGAGGQSVPGSSDTATLDGSSGGGTVTVSHASFSVTSVTMGAFTGTLDFAANNNNVALGTFSGTGTGARVLNMGSGTWTFSGTGVVLDFTTMTNLTLSAASVVLTFTATSAVARSITCGLAASFGTVNISANTSGGDFGFGGPSAATLTVATLNVTAPNRLVFTGSGSRVYAFTNGFAFNGTPGSYIAMSNTASSTFPTITSANAMTGRYCAIGGLTFAGGGSLTFQNSFDLGGVTISGGGVKTIIPPGISPSFHLGM